METNDENCPVCKQVITDTDQYAHLGVKGISSLNAASVERGDLPFIVTVNQKIHIQCRQKYTHKREILKHLQAKSEETPSTSKRPTRSREDFSFKTDCFFCCVGIPLENGEVVSLNSSKVTTLEFKPRLLKTCQERDDTWGNEVQARLLSIVDLPAADAIYHRNCYTYFVTKQQNPSNPEEPEAKKGRKQDEVAQVAFTEVCKYLEQTEDEQITVNDLIEMMKEKLEGTNSSAWSYPYMVSNLKKHFKDNIVFTNIKGKSNIVTFRKKTSTILQEFYEANQKKSDPDEEKIRLVKTAAELMKNDIKLIESNLENYDCINDLSLDTNLAYLPNSLKTFLGLLITSKSADLKIACLGQALIQACRPRGLLAPLSLGLAIQLHTQYSSENLIKSLYSMGYCASYDEVRRFEKCSAMTTGKDEKICDNAFINYSGDNVDHQLCTIDGKGTIHVMGIVAAINPEVKRKRAIPRIHVSEADIKNISHIKILYHDKNLLPDKLTYKPPSDFDYLKKSNLDLLWHSSILFRKPKPSWSGFMDIVHDIDHPGRSSIYFLPMIDLDPNDPSCILSTLNFILEHAEIHNCQPIITFDQPLYYKSVIIISNSEENSPLRKIVVRLGTFHTEMSYLGAIGQIMSGSGIKQMFEVNYASGSVIHMLSGKNIGRAVREHILLSDVLVAKLLTSCLNYELFTDNVSDTPPTTDDPVHAPQEQTYPSTDHQDLVTKLQSLYEKCKKEHVTSKEGIDDESLKTLEIMFQSKVEEVCSVSRTAKYWCQYLEMVQLLLDLIRSERLGCWLWHLQCLREMLPYFSASGHNLYSKSLVIYLDQMENLKNTHPDVYGFFLSGKHVVRRSDRPWAGLSTDLIIEQTLNRSLKTSGGLTHGSGMTQHVRNVWLASRPDCGEINSLMQELTGSLRKTSEQNKDLSQHRQNKDWEDLKLLYSFVKDADPFAQGPELKNVVDGTHALPSVNCDRAKEIGISIIEKMSGKNPVTHSFKRKDHVVTMVLKTAVKEGDNIIEIDPDLLFQRLASVAAKEPDSLNKALTFELSPQPPALFDKNLFMREAQKAQLADTLASWVTQCDLPSNVHYILDGGALLHRIPWQKGASFKAIFQVYVDYLKKHFSGAIICFDGYLGSSTKDMTHMRRTKGKSSPTISFTEDMCLSTTKESFLLNKMNKQKFIQLLSSELVKNSFMIYHADNDADLLIVEKTIESAQKQNSALIGDDTDLLILLLHHAKEVPFNIYFVPQHKSKKAKVWDIKKSLQEIPKDLTKHILFLHSFTGCDSTSRIHNLGKATAVKKMSKPEIKIVAETFLKYNASHEEIANAGETAFLLFYNSKNAKNLNELRVERFHEKVSSALVHVDSASLPPTVAAAKYHSFRTYFQIASWKNSHVSLLPTDWGWKKQGDQLIPIMTDQQPAPDNLLKVIKCSCTTDCSGRNCSCRKHFLKCSLACTNCKGTACTNATSFETEDMELPEL